MGLRRECADDVPPISHSDLKHLSSVFHSQRFLMLTDSDRRVRNWLASVIKKTAPKEKSPVTA